MEKIILGLIGVAAIYYVVRLLWKEAKGEAQCNCSQGGCGAHNQSKKSGCSSKDKV
jgi:hypothetical protein